MFVYNSFNIVDKHVNQFISVNSLADKDSEIFCYKNNFFATKLCSIILMNKIIEFYCYIENEKSNT